MRKLFTLAAASFLFLGLSGVAAALPIAVTYGIAPGTGSASWGAAASIPGMGNNGGQMVIVYSTGSTAIGGTLGSFGQVQVAQISFTATGTVLGGLATIPAMMVGGGLPGVRTPGGVGSFGPGATVIPASAFGPGIPPYTFAGTQAAIGFNPLGPITILVSGAGVQTVLGAVSANWTITGVIGQEISRAAVPEPATGMLLLGSLAGLAYGVQRRVRR